MKVLVDTNVILDVLEVDFIITRNKTDLQSSDIPCMTPTEFIAYLQENE